MCACVIEQSRELSTTTGLKFVLANAAYAAYAAYALIKLFLSSATVEASS